MVGVELLLLLLLGLKAKVTTAFLAFNFGAAFLQELDDLGVPGLHGDHDGRVSIDVPFVHFALALRQEGHELVVCLLDSEMKRCRVVVRLLNVNAGTVVQEHLNDF